MVSELIIIVGIVCIIVSVLSMMMYEQVKARLGVMALLVYHVAVWVLLGVGAMITLEILISRLVI